MKIDGRRASDWAERGKDFEMKPRRIHIESLKVVGEGGITEGCSGKEFATFDIECVCSKGTYVRALGRDIARARAETGVLRVGCFIRALCGGGLRVQRYGEERRQMV